MPSPEPSPVAPATAPENPGGRPAVVLGDGWVRAGKVAAVVLAVAAVVAPVALHLTGKDWVMIDLSVYRWGGEMVRTGGDLYGGVWTPSSPLVADSPLPFTYTPFAALVFVPLSLLPAAWAQVVVVLADVAAVGAVALASFRLAGVRRNAGCYGAALVVTVATLAFEPFTQTVLFGQLNLLILLLVVADVALPDDSRWKGVGIGVAAGLKLTPAIFVLYLLVTGRGRAAVRAMLVAVGTVLLGFALIPDASSTYWFGHLFADPRRVGGEEFVSNQSLNGLLIRALGPGATTHAVWLVLAAAVLGVGLWACRRLHAAGARLTAFLVVGAAGLLVSPISWSHHWVWVAPVAALAVVESVARRGFALAVAVVLAAVFSTAPLFPGVLWSVPSANGVERSWVGWEHVVGNSYVLCALVFLVVASLAALRPAGRALPQH